MTRKQVEQLTGAPTTVSGRCWLFKAKAGKVGGLPTRTVGALTLAQPGSDGSRTLDILKLCFVGGSLAQSFTHHTKLPYEAAGWSAPS